MPFAAPRSPCVWRLPFALSGAFLLGLLVACGGGGRSAPSVPGDDPGGPPGIPEGVRLDTDAPGAALSVGPQLATAGGRVHVVWYDRRDGLLDIYAHRSLDGGISWGALDRRLDTDAPGVGTSVLPRVAASGDTVFVVWQDERAGPGDIRYNRSLDGGATWLTADRRVDRDGLGAADSRTPALDLDGPRVSVVWRDARDGSFGIHFNQSVDAGDTWRATDVRIDGGTPGSTVAREPHIVRTPSALLVFWIDDSLGGADVFATRSTDEGVTFSTPLRLSRGGGGARDASGIVCAFDGERVAVAFRDAAEGAPAIHVRTSEDGGATWSLGESRATPAGAASEAPAVAWIGGLPVVAYEDHTSARIRVRSTQPDGQGGWVAPRLVDDAPAALASAVRPQVLMLAGRAVFLWLDERDGGLAPRWRQADAGGGLASASAPLATPAGPAARVVAGVGAGVDGPVVLGVWSDQRSGQADIYTAAVHPR